MKALCEKHLAALLCAAGGVALALTLPSCSNDSQNAVEPGEDAGTDVDAGGGAEPERFTAFLSAAQTVPPSNSTATGVAEFAFTASTGTLTYSIVHNEANAYVGHIHPGHAAVNGDPIHTLSGVTSPITGSVVLEGGVNGQAYQNLINGRLYVNLHLQNFSELIRGQILRPGERLYSGQLNDLVGGITDGGAGGAAFILSADGATLKWDVTLKPPLGAGAVPTASHIHQDLPGGHGTGNGPVIFNIGGAGVAGGMGVAGGSGSRAFTPAEVDVVNQLNNDNTYFNVHTSARPAGHVQGDLTKK